MHLNTKGVRTSDRGLRKLVAGYMAYFVVHSFASVL